MSLLDSDQQAAITRLIEHDRTLLIAGMGAGKTVVALTAAAELLDMKAVKRVLVVAPVRVCNLVWATEHMKWSHLQGLTVALATGTPAKRRAAFSSDAQIVVVNIENIAWMVGEKLYEGFDGVVFDESSRLKSVGSVAVKRLRHRLKGFKWRVCMSGTPVSEGLLDLYAQMLLLGLHTVLAATKQDYLDKWFMPTDYERHSWAPRERSGESIARAISVYTHVVPDYTHTLPPLTIDPVKVLMPPEAMKEYRQLARTSVLADVTAVNAAVLQGKLQQVAAGFVYTDSDEKNARTIHDAKVIAAREWIAEAAEHGERAIIVYQWDWQRDALAAQGVELFTSTLKNYERWNSGQIAVMGLHPKSAGHGLNLQDGGFSMLWLSPVWSRDLWDQTIARLWRRGQSSPVRVNVLVAEDTVDNFVLDRLENKEAALRGFLDHLESIQTV